MTNIPDLIERLLAFRIRSDASGMSDTYPTICKEAAQALQRTQRKCDAMQSQIDEWAPIFYKQDQRIEQLEGAREHWYCEYCGCGSCLDAEESLQEQDDGDDKEGLRTSSSRD